MDNQNGNGGGGGGGGGGGSISGDNRACGLGKGGPKHYEKSNNNDAGGSQESNKKRNYDDQTLIPVTMQMALNARRDHQSDGDDGRLVLQDGRPVSLVKIVGAVRMFEEQSTNVLYRIEDGTGIMEVKQWVDDNDCSAVKEMRTSTLQDNIYVKAIGQIKEYDNQKMIVANMIRPLTTGNELTHHFLEVVNSAERSKRAHNNIVTPVKPAVAINNNMMGGGGMMSNHAVPGGSNLSQNILNFLKQWNRKFFSHT